MDGLYYVVCAVIWDGLYYGVYGVIWDGLYYERCGVIWMVCIMSQVCGSSDVGSNSATCGTG